MISVCKRATQSNDGSIEIRGKLGLLRGTWHDKRRPTPCPTAEVCSIKVGGDWCAAGCGAHQIISEQDRRVRCGPQLTPLSCVRQRHVRASYNVLLFTEVERKCSFVSSSWLSAARGAQVSKAFPLWTAQPSRIRSE
jgi:hypothetical protein